jgi:hypothetical protein
MDKREIGEMAGFMMVGTALVFDIVEVIIKIFTAGTGSTVLGVFQYGIMFLWFKQYGGSFFFRKKGGGAQGASKTIRSSTKGVSVSGQIKSTDGLSLNWSQVMGFVLESIPIIAALPIYTYNVWAQKNAHNKEVRESEAQQKSEKNQNEQIIRMSKASERQLVQK